MEFKAPRVYYYVALVCVDVETEWNLKQLADVIQIQHDTVDVETEWNLK